MTKAGKCIIEGAKEALAIAKGEIPAARITINGHAYVPETELDAVKAKLAKAVEALQPFSEAYDDTGGDHFARDDNECVEGASFTTYGDLRRARSTLAEIGETS